MEVLCIRIWEQPRQASWYWGTGHACRHTGAHYIANHRQAGGAWAKCGPRTDLTPPSCWSGSQRSLVCMVWDVFHLQQCGCQPLRELLLDHMLLCVLGDNWIACNHRHGGRVWKTLQDPHAMNAGRYHGVADEQHECGSVYLSNHSCYPVALKRSLSPHQNVHSQYIYT